MLNQNQSMSQITLSSEVKYLLSLPSNERTRDQIQTVGYKGNVKDE